jgi:hypothetical protein
MARLSYRKYYRNGQWNITTLYYCIREKLGQSLLWHSITPGRVCGKQYRQSVANAELANSSRKDN